MNSRNAVVIIDDDADMRELIRLILEPMGLAVLEAENCRVGVAIVDRERDRLRLILLDYFMPEVLPAACAAAIREHAGADVLVVLFTAAGDPAARAKEVGLSRWLGKPFGVQQLLTLAGVE
jgi:CheY-like chemotaxis protein